MYKSKKCNKKMIKIANKMLLLMRKYIEEYEKQFEPCEGFVYIETACDEILCFAESKETLEANIKYIK